MLGAAQATIRCAVFLALFALLAAALPAPAAAAPPQADSLLAAATNEKEVVTDPAEDTALTLAGVEGAPPNDVDAAADILSLKVAETGDALRLSLQHRGYPDAPATLSELILFQQTQCTIEFVRGGYDNVTWGINVYGENLLDGGPYVYQADSYVQAEDEDSFRFEFLDELEVAQVAGDHLEVIVPKTLFEYADPETPLAIGDTLEAFTVYCDKWITFAVWFQDTAESAPGEAGKYEVRISGLGSEITLAFPAAEDGPVPPLSVAVTHPARAEVVVTNVLDRKLLVNLTATITDTAGAPLAGWKVQAAPALELGAEKSLTASLVVTAPADAAHRSGGLLTVKAFAIGYEQTATLTRPVHAIVSPSVEQNTLYFHNAPVEGTFCPGICDETVPMAWDPFYDNFILNVLETDPQFDDAQGTDDGVAILSDDYAIATLDAPLADAIRFDPDGLFQLTVALRSQVARDVQMDVYLLADHGELYLGGATETLSLGSAYSTFTIPFGLRSEIAQLDADSMIELRFQFQEGGPAGAFQFTSDAWVASVEWDPDQSNLALPLVPVPQTVFNVTDGRALPTVALTNTTDAEDFVNPGESQAFQLLLVNEGTELDVVTLTADLDLPGWSFEFSPGHRFRLEPGSSAPLCISLLAPKDATESQVLTVNLTATSDLDALVRTTAQLRLIVTNLEQVAGVCSIAEDEFVAPLREAKKDSPAPAPLAIAALAALLLAGVRRRRA